MIESSCVNFFLLSIIDFFKNVENRDNAFHSYEYFLYKIFNRGLTVLRQFIFCSDLSAIIVLTLQ